MKQEKKDAIKHHIKRAAKRLHKYALEVVDSEHKRRERAGKKRKLAPKPSLKLRISGKGGRKRVWHRMSSR